jgi:ABC-2 type transport system ATP-binding protein
MAVAAPAITTKVEVHDLVKRYPKAPVAAVDGISFDVRDGEIFGLLGPNGAGKTTTVGILTTRVRATSGQATINGLDVLAHPVQARAQLAVVPQRSNLDRSISIRNNLLFHAAYHGVPKADRQARTAELLEQFGLTARADAKPDFISGGQSQRIMIARALMHEPAVLFLDEPSTGLDPAARLFLWDRLRELRERGVTLVLTTHDMREAATLSDRVAIMDHGRLLAIDTPERLIDSLPGSATLELAVAGGVADLDALRAELAALRGVERADAVPAEGETRIRLYLSEPAPRFVAPAAGVLAKHDLELSDVRIGKPSLEDVFLHLTGRALR